jgi:hypothetical protein
MTVMVADLALMPLLFLPAFLTLAEGQAVRRLGLTLYPWASRLNFALVSFIFTGLALPLLLVWAGRAVAGQDLDPYARRRVVRLLLFGPTSNRAVWRRPEVLRVLRPAAARPTPTAAPQTPRACLAAIAQLARERSTGPPERAESVIESGRRLVAEIEALDQELASLERAADAAELARLEERRERIDGDAAAGPDPQTRELRDLLSRQVDILKGYAARLEAGRARRRALWEHLLGLWRALEARPSGPGTTPVDLGDDLARRLAEIGDLIGPSAEADPTGTTSATRTAPGAPARH